MTPGPRTHRSASCRIAIAEGLPEEMRKVTRELLEFRSLNPRKGHASALMHQVTAEADRAWITLLIQVRPFHDSGMTQAQLESFYARHSFEKIQDTPVVLMVRSPEKPKIARLH